MIQKSMRLFYGTLSICLLLPIGCSKNNTISISGTVTVESSPVESGFISFIPLDGESQEGGAVIKDGEYRAAVPPGEKIVKIRADKLEDIESYDEVTKTTHTGKAGVMISPPEYNSAKSPLRATVTKNGETFDFELPALKGASTKSKK